MLRLLTIALLFAVSLGFEALSFGETKSAETLFQASTPSPTHVNSELSEPTRESLRHLQARSEFEHPTGRTWFNMDDHFHNKDGDDWGLYVPIDLVGETTVVRRAVGIEKRAQKAGVVQLDCSMAPEVCRNAGFYQNCMMGAKGIYNRVTYKNGPLEPSKDTPKADRNRFNSGVSTTYSTPCKAWPFAQRFWNFLKETKGLDQMEIQTDEWPMATMEQGGKFDPNHPVALRCMSNAENTRGSDQVMPFRRGVGHYAMNGKWEQHRNAKLLDQPLGLGDTYFVQFNFDKFPRTRTNAPMNRLYWNLRDSLRYADAENADWDVDCKNDMRQFHLTQLRPASAKEKSGKLGAICDSGIHNTYRLADEDDDIKQYHVTLAIIGKKQDQATAEVYHYYNMQKVMLPNTQKAQSMASGDSFTLTSTLPKPLRIERLPDTTNGMLFQFEYADKKSEPIRYFQFNSDNTRRGPKEKTGFYKYCNKCTKGSQTTFHCSFPAW